MFEMNSRASEAASNVVFRDLQELENPMNGSRLPSAFAIAAAFRSFAGRKPFLFELERNDGSVLTIGFGGNYGCVQHSATGGSPPYLMALGDEDADDGKFLEFLAGNTPTPIPQRFCLPIEQVVKIVSEFIEYGTKSKAVTWEEI